MVSMRMKLESNRRQRLHSSPGLGPEEPVSLHLQTCRSGVDRVLGHEKSEQRKPGTVLSPGCRWN